MPRRSGTYWMPRPYVVTIHDMSTVLFPNKGDVRSALHNERYRRGATRAARVIAVSQSTRRDIETVIGIPAERVRTIYSAPDPAFHSPSGDAGQDQRLLEKF